MKNVTVDDDQEFVFRFRIPSGHQRLERSLEEFYRRQILELVRIVQFRAGDRPVEVDSFSFRNDPEQVIDILPASEAEPRPVQDTARPARSKSETT